MQILSGKANTQTRCLDYTFRLDTLLVHWTVTNNPFQRGTGCKPYFPFRNNTTQDTGSDLKLVVGSICQQDSPNTPLNHQQNTSRQHSEQGLLMSKHTCNPLDIERTDRLHPNCKFQSHMPQPHS
ncbi:hypothetical protein PInf_012122 [Phytophthora infestans]|nr:hypothetical protein PInf_012122 [Phytophthora infestans]